MAELTYRDAVARGIAQEMERDERVVFLGEDVAKAGGVFKATVGLYEQFGPLRVRDTPISEQAIMGAAMGAAMTAMPPRDQRKQGGHGEHGPEAEAQPAQDLQHGIHRNPAPRGRPTRADASVMILRAGRETA